MRNDSATQFGGYLQDLRHQRHLSVRELARRTGLDSGGLTRLERGLRTPMPDTLKALAEVLQVPVADLFARAGYLTPSDLPNLSTYLRVQYGDMPEQKLASLEAYVQHLIDNRGLDTDGPATFEDEEPSQD